MRSLVILALGLVLIQLFATPPTVCSETNRDEAYVTLLYGDEFLLGVRVLGKSIRGTGSRKDMVALVSDGVSDYAKMLLKADGWIVEMISLLANPNSVRPTRFWGVYTKLKIFNMTNYKKVVYLDADTIVVKSIEDLFKCGKFCANLKHSERLNSGVMVVEPSAEVFNDMMRQVNTLPSYTGGDQGFLNSYYKGFANAHVFEPNLPEDVRKSRPVPEMERLSTLYNADVGLYMLANKWMVDEKDLHVIHYTLGPLKPWDWWTSWLLKPVDVWQNVRERLPESLPGTGGGKNPKDNVLVKLLVILPFITLFFCYYRSLLQAQELFGLLCRTSLCDHFRHIYCSFRSGGPLAYAAVSTSAIDSSHQFSAGVSSKVPVYLGGCSILACFMSAMTSFMFALTIVPRQVMPWTGLLLMYEWTFATFFILFGGCLRLIYLWGRTVAARSSNRTLNYDSGKGRTGSSCDSAALSYGLGMAFLAIATPSLPCLFGITALFPRLGLMVAGGLILASFMTYASEHLSLRFFLRGLEERDTTRPRNRCFLC